MELRLHYLKPNQRLETLLYLVQLQADQLLWELGLEGLSFPQLGAVFLGIGAGAILQVIFVISKMLMEDHKTHHEPVVSWMNFAGFTIGLLIMYFTAFFVKF